MLAGALIIVAALLILREAWHAVRAPRMIDAPAEGLALSGVASAINAGWAWVLDRAGRASCARPRWRPTGGTSSPTSSPRSAWSIGILLAVVTGWAILDPALAALVALNILWSGWQVIRESLGGLMDEAVPRRAARRDPRRDRAAMPRARSRRTTCAPATPAG